MQNSSYSTLQRTGSRGLPMASFRTRLRRSVMNSLPIATNRHQRHSTASPIGVSAGPNSFKDVRSISCLVAVAQEPQTEKDAVQKYSWSPNWYPVIPVSYLEADKPTAFTLLGKDMVLWKDNSGTWRCFEDACPHRLAPLSEGYINRSKGALLCSYHGWEFEPDGRCSAIPQTSGEALANACSSSRSKVHSYPTAQGWGLMWVWPEAGPEAFIHSAARPVNLPDVVQTSPGELMYFNTEAGWVMRELPISYELLLENILDLSHVPFSHHNVAGKRESALPVNMDVERPVDVKDPAAGFVLASSIWDSGQKKFGFTSAKVEFHPPNMVHYINYGKDGEERSYLTTYATPVGPGRARYFSRVYFRGGKLPSLPLVARKLPIWFTHLRSHTIGDSDTLLAAGQQRALRQRPGSPIQQEYYMPAQSDKAISLFYTWLTKCAGQGPFGLLSGPAPAAPGGNGTSPAVTSAPSSWAPVPSHQETLDRWSQHTQHCPFCKDGVAFTERAMQLLAAAMAAAVLLVLTQLAVAKSVGLLPGVIAGALLAGGAFLMQKLQKLRQAFFFEDYQFHTAH